MRNKVEVINKTMVLEAAAISCVFLEGFLSIMIYKDLGPMRNALTLSLMISTYLFCIFTCFYFKDSLTGEIVLIPALLAYCCTVYFSILWKFPDPSYLPKFFRDFVEGPSRIIVYSISYAWPLILLVIYFKNKQRKRYKKLRANSTSDLIPDALPAPETPSRA